MLGVAQLSGGRDLSGVVTGAIVGVAIPLVLFRLLAPERSFPISYRRGKSAHLPVEGPRGQAIRRALADQLGIGVAGGSHGIIICKTAITGTKLSGLPVDIGGSEDVGDGFNWRDGSEVKVEEVTLGGNARASLIIDGSATGSLTNTLSLVLVSTSTTSC